jgi:hypothetical protein
LLQGQLRISHSAWPLKSAIHEVPWSSAYHVFDRWRNLACG